MWGVCSEEATTVSVLVAIVWGFEGVEFKPHN